MKSQDTQLIGSLTEFFCRSMLIWYARVFIHHVCIFIVYFSWHGVYWLILHVLITEQNSERKSRIVYKGWCISYEFCHKRLLFIIKFKLNTNLYQIKIFLDRIYGFIQMIKSLVRIIRVRATRRGVEAAKQGTCFE